MFPARDETQGSCYLKGHCSRLGSCSLVEPPTNSPAWVAGRGDKAPGQLVFPNWTRGQVEDIFLLIAHMCSLGLWLPPKVNVRRLLIRGFAHPVLQLPVLSGYRGH